MKFQASLDNQRLNWVTLIAENDKELYGLCELLYLLHLQDLPLDDLLRNFEDGCGSSIPRIDVGVARGYLMKGGADEAT